MPTHNRQAARTVRKIRWYPGVGHCAYLTGTEVLLLCAMGAQFKAEDIGKATQNAQRGHCAPAWFYFTCPKTAKITEALGS